jgi:hypothetical protein
MVRLIVFIQILSLLAIEIYTFNSDNKQKKGHQTQLEIAKIKEMRSKLSYKKNCMIKEHCKECTFEELKNLPECQSTGAKLLKQCAYFDENKNLENYLYNEPCIDGKISSIFIFLFCSVILTICSFILRKTRKEFLVSQVLDKLTIFKKNVYN